MSSSNANSKQLHWTQRVALIRHNLHAASRSSDFGFFKSLQAAGFMEGRNDVATLSAELGGEADIVLAAMDNLNAGLAYVHQDAFKNVYENLKNNLRNEDTKADKAKLYVDITMQKNMADMAIDKMTSSALTLIHQQPANAQELAANVWITGTTLIADAMDVALYQVNTLDTKLDDFIRMEESWAIVKASVVCAVTALKGVFRLMDLDAQDSPKPHQRSSSIVSASNLVLRRLSNAFVGNGSSNSSANAAQSPHTSRSSSDASFGSGIQGRNPSFASGRNPSVSSQMAPVYRTPNYMRTSVSAGCPTAMPASVDLAPHKLSTIPPTPAAPLHDDEERDPFDNSVPPLPAMPAHSHSAALNVDLQALNGPEAANVSFDQKRLSLAAF